MTTDLFRTVSILENQDGWGWVEVDESGYRTASSGDKHTFRTQQEAYGNYNAYRMYAHPCNQVVHLTIVYKIGDTCREGISHRRRRTNHEAKFHDKPYLRFQNKR